MNVLEPVRFPRASDWLGRAPAGLKSYPECICNTDLARLILDEFPQVMGEGVSAGLKKTLVDTIREKEKMPDAWSVLLRLMMRDAGFQDDAAFLRWNLNASARVFATPLYRVLMHVLSPSLVLAGAQRRWNAYRTGTNLSSEGDKRAATLRLTYPSGLYPALVARSYGESFRAALQAAKAEEVQIAMASHSDTEARYTLSWK